MEHPEPPASDPQPPARDIHADSDVPVEEKPTVKLPLPPAAGDDRCGNIHCACHHS